jgi:hypothetical protein
MEANSKRRRWQLRRVFVVSVAIIAVAWGMLQLMRYRAEHRAIPVFVILQLPPSGPMAASFIAAGMTNIGTPVPYQQVTNPPISMADVAAIKRCLAREQFLPLFPLEIEIREDEVTAPYRMKIHRRTNRMRETVVEFVQRENSWHIAGIKNHRGTACPIYPPTRWEKLLSYLPFTD